MTTWPEDNEQHALQGMKLMLPKWSGTYVCIGRTRRLGCTVSLLCTHHSNPFKHALYYAVLVQPGDKGPQPMPEAAKEALNSSEEFNTSMPKRH